MSTLEHNKCLHDIIFEIEQAGKSLKAPSWADGENPLAHHTLLYTAKGEGDLRINGHFSNGWIIPQSATAWRLITPKSCLRSKNSRLIGHLFGWPTLTG